jgi:predicted CXXCH cytochrome family protein
MTRRALSVLLLLLLLAPAAAHAVAVGDKAEPFVGNDTTGSTLWIKRYFGRKVIILSFDSTRSSASPEGLREIDRVRRAVKSPDLQLVSVNVDSNSPERIRTLYSVIPEDSKFPIVIDDSWTIARLYKIASVPTHVVIDRKGVVHYVSDGTQGDADKGLEAAVRAALAGKKPVPPAKARKKKGAAELEPGLSVVAPAPFTKTLTSMITVAGSAPAGSAVTVSANGGKPRSVVLRGDTFFVRSPLTLAANFIEVRAEGADGTKRQQGIPIFREADAGTGIVADLPSYYFHNDASEAPCRRCHDVTPSEEKAKGLDPKTNPCLSCHQEMSGRKIVHGPIAIGGCSSCHLFKGGEHRYARNAEGAELCFGCHDESRGAASRKFKHEPAADGRCTACHDPHGSQEKFQLRRYIGDQCYSCHSDSQPLGGKSSHDPYQKGRCDVCHAPHGTDREAKLLRLPGDRQCLSCHPDLPSRGHVHPSGATTKMKLPEDILLDSGGRLLCLSCHEPHESGEIKLLKKGGCERCHEKKF